jgi:hypothetical protein
MKDERTLFLILHPSAFILFHMEVKGMLKLRPAAWVIALAAVLFLVIDCHACGRHRGRHGGGGGSCGEACSGCECGGGGGCSTCQPPAPPNAPPCDCAPKSGAMILKLGRYWSPAYAGQEFRGWWLYQGAGRWAWYGTPISPTQVGLVAGNP